VIGYWLGEEMWNRGLMTKAIELFNIYVFDQFNPNSLLAYIEKNEFKTTDKLIKRFKTFLKK